MIIRITQKLAKKIKESKLDYIETSQNPFLDWSTNLFTSGKTQYIIFTNSESLFSVVFPGAGINNSAKFLKSINANLHDILSLYRLESLWDEQKFDFTSVSFSKIKDKSVLGSMNELVFQAKFFMANWKLDSIQATMKINNTIMGKIEYDKPLDRFLKLTKEV